MEMLLTEDRVGVARGKEGRGKEEEGGREGEKEEGRTCVANHMRGQIHHPSHPHLQPSSTPACRVTVPSIL